MNNPGKHYRSTNWETFYQQRGEDYTQNKIRTKHATQIRLIRSDLRQQGWIKGYIISGTPMKNVLKNRGFAPELEISDGDDKEKANSLDGYMYVLWTNNSDAIEEYIIYHKDKLRKGFERFKEYEKILDNTKKLSESAEFKLS